MKIWFVFELDDVEHEVELDCTVQPAEPDVGISSEYAEDWTVTINNTGVPNDTIYKLIEEDENLRDQIQDKIRSAAYDGPDWEYDL